MPFKLFPSVGLFAEKQNLLILITSIGIYKLLEMETCVDFFSWLDYDMLMRILMCLEDPSDLVRVSSVSRSWREFGEWLYCSCTSALHSLYPYRFLMCCIFICCLIVISRIQFHVFNLLAGQTFFFSLACCLCAKLSASSDI